MRVRVKFAKGEPLRFLSHLDLMRTFQRVFRRAGIPLAYSQGFNPHPKIAFSPALPVGAVSEGEYMDVELKETMLPKELLAQMKPQLPAGLGLIDALEIPSTAGALNAQINRAGYNLLAHCTYSAAEVKTCLEGLLAREKIIIQKRTKKGMREQDIRPGVYTLDCSEQAGEICVQMMLLTGSQGNVKPDYILGELNNQCGLALNHPRIIRTGLYISNGKNYQSPLEVCSKSLPTGHKHRSRSKKFKAAKVFAQGH